MRNRASPACQSPAGGYSPRKMDKEDKMRQKLLNAQATQIRKSQARIEGINRNRRGLYPGRIGGDWRILSADLPPPPLQSVGAIPASRVAYVCLGMRPSGEAKGVSFGDCLYVVRVWNLHSRYDWGQPLSSHGLPVVYFLRHAPGGCASFPSKQVPPFAPVCKMRAN